MWNNATHSFHIGAWALWLAAAMLVALSTRNPFYLLLTIAIAILVNRSLNGTTDEEMRNVEFGIRNVTGDNAIQIQEPEAGSQSREIRIPHSAFRNPRALLLRAVIILAFAVAILKGLSYHIGETVLFSLPGTLPVIGGPVTAEGLAAAGLDGLSILTVLAVFTAFGAGADYYAMLRSVPPFMHQVALVTSIAITFVPQTVIRFAEIREAQALRGHRVRRIGDLVPLVMPLLAGGMERSMNLAEAMESRGFSRPSAAGRRVPPLVVQLGLTFGLAFVLVGSTLFAFAPDMPWLAWLLIAAGLLFITHHAASRRGRTEAKSLPPQHLAGPRHTSRCRVGGRNRYCHDLQIHSALTLLLRPIPPHLRAPLRPYRCPHYPCLAGPCHHPMG